jgi:hypothetical protein
MKLIVTIDTEEDDWGNFSAPRFSVENIGQIPELQQMFDEFKVRPTYLITYPVATDAVSVSVLRKISAAGQCEIGTHCHPWSTPPVEEKTNEKNSMMCNLPADLQYRKLACLHETITKNFNVVPVSFRTGRWGYGKEVASSLDRLGYRVDSSVPPFTNWTKYYGPDFSMISLEPYYFNPEEIFKPDPRGRMLEVPATIGFTQGNFRRCNDLFRAFQKRPLSRLHLIGVTDRLRLLNRVYLSPEVSTADQMIALTRRLVQMKIPFVNFFFHSPTLLAGCSPFVRSDTERKQFLARIREYLVFTAEKGIRSITLSEAREEMEAIRPGHA